MFSFAASSVTNTWPEQGENRVARGRTRGALRQFGPGATRTTLDRKLERNDYRRVEKYTSSSRVRVTRRDATLRNGETRDATSSRRRCLEKRTLCMRDRSRSVTILSTSYFNIALVPAYRSALSLVEERNKEIACCGGKKNEKRERERGGGRCIIWRSLASRGDFSRKWTFSAIGQVGIWALFVVMTLKLHLSRPAGSARLSTASARIHRVGAVDPTGTW